MPLEEAQLSTQTQTQAQISAEEEKFNEWKRLPLAEKLKVLDKSNFSLVAHDCTLSLVTPAAFFATGLYSPISVIALLTILGSRAKASVDQHKKLEYLYKLYEAVVKRKSAEIILRLEAKSDSNTPVANQAINYISNAVATTVSNTVWSAVSAIGNKIGITSTPKSEPEIEIVDDTQAITILKAIGSYLHPEQIAIWECSYQNIPQEYKTAMHSFGIYAANESLILNSPNQSNNPNNSNNANNPAERKVDYSFKTYDNTYNYCSPDPRGEAKIQDRSRKIMYGYGNYVNRGLTPVGNIAGKVVEYAGAFAQNHVLPSIMPTINSWIASAGQAAASNMMNNISNNNNNNNSNNNSSNSISNRQSSPR